jgi:hypothetical protein
VRARTFCLGCAVERRKCCCCCLCNDAMAHVGCGCSLLLLAVYRYRQRSQTPEAPAPKPLARPTRPSPVLQSAVTGAPKTPACTPSWRGGDERWLGCAKDEHIGAALDLTAATLDCCCAQRARWLRPLLPFRRTRTTCDVAALASWWRWTTVCGVCWRVCLCWLCGVLGRASLTRVLVRDWARTWRRQYAGSRCLGFARRSIATWRLLSLRSARWVLQKTGGSTHNDKVQQTAMQR